MPGNARAGDDKLRLAVSGEAGISEPTLFHEQRRVGGGPVVLERINPRVHAGDAASKRDAYAGETEEEASVCRITHGLKLEIDELAVLREMEDCHDEDDRRHHCPKQVRTPCDAVGE